MTGRPPPPPPPPPPSAAPPSSATRARWFDVDSDNNSGPGPRPPMRARRRPAAGGDQIKHRRTRSGCYTCRSRRVKCDEKHPICERCKKASRECIYPEPTAARPSPGAKLGRLRKPSLDSASSSDGCDDDEADPTSPVDPAPRPEPPAQPRPRPSLPAVRAASRQQSRQPLALSRPPPVAAHPAKDSSLSPSTDGSAWHKSRSASATYGTSGKLSTVSTSTSLESSWSHLPRAIQFYLDYHQQHLNHHHYLVKHDPKRFVHHTLLGIALEYEPLLYAVVGFSAYHSTVRNPNGRIQDFLSYYNRAVSLLRKSLQAGQPHTDATILTILQLAAFEEYLGDWANLLTHQKAALDMVRELYGPATIMRTATSRWILFWYMRFDLYAGLMSGHEAVLSREWFTAYEAYFAEMLRLDPTNVDYELGGTIAANVLVGTDMALLYAKLPRGAISVDDFLAENEKIAESIRSCRRRTERLQNRPHCLVTSFDGAPPPDPDDIVDPYRPGGLYRAELWTLNFLLIDFCALEAMQLSATAKILQRPLPPELVELALEQCRIMEAMEFWPGSPAGAILPSQASLGLICLHLPRDERHTMWCRRKLATLESMGYTYPPTFRAKMAEFWDLPDLHHWWLPHNADYPPIIRAIRHFIEERTQKPRNQTSEDVRSMKAVFSAMHMDDATNESPDSAGSVGTEVAAHYQQAEQNIMAQSPVVTDPRHVRDSGAQFGAPGGRAAHLSRQLMGGPQPGGVPMGGQPMGSRSQHQMGTGIGMGQDGASTGLVEAGGMHMGGINDANREQPASLDELVWSIGGVEGLGSEW